MTYMNGHGADDEAAKRKEFQERSVRVAQLLANKIALEIVNMISEKHPGTHPGIVTSALVNSMASLIVLFAENNETRADEGARVVYQQLRSTVKSMVIDANKRGLSGKPH